MEEQNNYSIHIKTNTEILHLDEISEIVKMICEMAKETENKSLDEIKVTDAVKNFISNNIYGQYFLVVDNINHTFSGMNMITYEYNINTNKTIVWIQSVFIEKEYRMKKLFRKLLQENENHVKTNSNFEQKVKLYMEKNNVTAEQVYLKVGFQVTDEILYEIDYDFDDIKFLTSDSKFYEENLGINMTQNSISVLTNANSSFINEYLNSEFHSKINNKKLILNEHLQSIHSVLSDDKKGKIIYVTDNINNKVICFFYIFYEYSDWRNSIFWWVNDFIINPSYFGYVDSNMQKIIYSLVKMNYQSGSCGLRFLAKSDNGSYLENTVLNKSHYIIYEKNI